MCDTCHRLCSVFALGMSVVYLDDYNNSLIQRRSAAQQCRAAAQQRRSAAQIAAPNSGSVPDAVILLGIQSVSEDQSRSEPGRLQSVTFVRRSSSCGRDASIVEVPEPL